MSMSMMGRGKGEATGVEPVHARNRDHSRCGMRQGEIDVECHGEGIGTDVFDLLSGMT